MHTCNLSLSHTHTGHIPAGSTDAVCYSLHGNRGEITAALHIAFGDRYELECVCVMSVCVCVYVCVIYTLHIHVCMRYACVVHSFHQHTCAYIQTHSPPTHTQKPSTHSLSHTHTHKQTPPTHTHSTGLDAARVDTGNGKHCYAVTMAAYGYLGDLMRESEGLRWYVGGVRKG